MLIRVLCLIFMASLSGASQTIKEPPFLIAKATQDSKPQTIYIHTQPHLHTAHRATQEAQLNKIYTLIKNAPPKKNTIDMIKEPKPRSAIFYTPYMSFKPMEANWKDNSPVLQNPDSIFNLPNISNIPYANMASEPFAPPFKHPFLLGVYLEPSGVLPNILPPPISIPPMVLQELEPYKKDFIISYEFLLKNEVPSGEKFNISEPMINRQMDVSYECVIDSVVNEDFDGDGVLDILLKLLLEHHKDEVLECLYKAGVMLREDGISQRNASNNKTLFSLPPTYVRTTLENGFLKILVLEKR